MNQHSVVRTLGGFTAYILLFGKISITSLLERGKLHLFLNPHFFHQKISSLNFTEAPYCLLKYSILWPFFFFFNMSWGYHTNKRFQPRLLILNYHFKFILIIFKILTYHFSMIRPDVINNIMTPCHLQCKTHILRKVF